jgi:hypothetical protein
MKWPINFSAGPFVWVKRMSSPAASLQNGWRQHWRQWLAWEKTGWLLAVLPFLILVWSVTYLPTQDGSAHLANSLILRDYGQPDNRFDEFYWISWRPLPNWTCFALLAGFSSVLPPLAAEKLLVSLYLVGFALSYRYFLGAVGNPCSWLVLAGFLLVFNRCLWLGFYNYCLSLVLYFFVVGFFLRRWEQFHWRDALILGLLFLLVFFTHLFGFILAAGSCFWLAVTIPRRSVEKYLLLVAALLPVLFLTQVFFEDAQFYGSSGFGRLREHLWAWVEGPGQWAKIRQDALALNKELFGIELHKTIYLGMAIAFLYGGFLLAGLWKPERAIPGQAGKLRALFCLGLLFALMYFLLPNFLTFGKGGFWKTRLVLLPPLLWLSCSRVTSLRSVRISLGLATLLLLSINLGIITSFVHRLNQDLTEFTAGVDIVGQDRAIFFNIHSAQDEHGAVNLLIHAGEYYCLESQNINLAHPFTNVLHAVVRLRPEIEEGRGHLESYSHQSLADVIVIWDTDYEPDTDDFRIIFQRGRLRILERAETSE